MTKQKAFTLIELLVVIAIIGILATLAIVSLQQARQNARNAKRVADLRQIQTALELYFNENNSYPSTEEFIIGGQLISSSTAKVLMNQVPSAPAVADGECLTSNYTYTVNEDNSSYKLTTCISKDINNLPAGTITVTPNFIGYLDACNNQTEFTDSRDNTTYKIVAIGEQCWMAENLKYLPEVFPSSDGSSVYPRYYVYTYQGYSVEEAKLTSYYSIYGVLYNWIAAMNMGLEEGAQGACPDSWYIPTDADWTTLTNYVGINNGTKLKASSPAWDGDDIYGFTALPAGYRNVAAGLIYGFGSRVFMWSSSSASASSAWRRYFFSSSLSRNADSFASGFSVRCLKNN